MSQDNTEDEPSVSASLEEDTHKTEMDDINELNDRIDDLRQTQHPVMSTNNPNSNMPMTNARMSLIKT